MKIISPTNPIQCLLLLVIICSGFVSNGQNFTVGSTADGIDANPGDGVCDDGSGTCTLRAAIMESNALGGAHTITLAASTYTLTIAGASEDGCATGDLDISSNITINGISAQTTIINAGALDRAIHIVVGGTLTSSQVSVSGGSIDRHFGGGILNAGTLNFTYGEIYGNTADLIDEVTGVFGGFGGGLANEGTATLDNATIRANQAIGSEGPRSITGGGGGGSTPGFGGGIYNANGATLTLVNTTISGNQAMGGRGSRGSANGGVWNAAGSAGGHTLFGIGGAAGGGAGGNAAGDYSGGGGGGSMGTGGGAGGTGGYGAGGGAVGARSGGGSSVNPVGAGGFGGGSGNNACCSSGGGGGAGAGFGGGIFNNGGDITATNTTIAFNEALGGNGRTVLGGWAGRGLIGSGLGGGIFNRSGTVEINNTLLSNNNTSYLTGTYIAFDTTYQDVWGTFTSATGYNLIRSTGTATIGGTTTGNVIGQDPLLTALAMNGGTTLTHAISDCTTPSPAIDAGLDAVAPALDQRLFARFNVFSGPNISDIGAFESNCIILPVKLLSFDIDCRGDKPIVHWISATEINNNYYTIERSNDAINYKVVGTVSGNGNSSDLIEYNWIDETPLNEAAYYRLKQTDFNGAFEYLDVKSVRCTSKGDITIYPNPFKSQFTVVLPENTSYPVVIEVFDYLGKLVLSKTIDEDIYKVDLDGIIPSGTYVIKVYNQSIHSINRIVKLK